MKIIAIDHRGWLYINNIFVGDLDLTTNQNTGDAKVGAQFFTGQAKDNEYTKVTNFYVRDITTGNVISSSNIPHEPESGRMDSSKDSESYNYGSFSNVRNFLLETQFTNPFSTQTGKWTSGVDIRKTASSAHHIMILHDGTWIHHLRNESGDFYVEDKYSSSIKTKAGETNSLRIIADGHTGSLFINDNYIGNLDLSESPERGTFKHLAHFFSGYGVQGYSTFYSNHKIWSLGEY